MSLEVVTDVRLAVPAPGSKSTVSAKAPVIRILPLPSSAIEFPIIVDPLPCLVGKCLAQV